MLISSYVLFDFDLFLGPVSLTMNEVTSKTTLDLVYTLYLPFFYLDVSYYLILFIPSFVSHSCS